MFRIFDGIGNQIVQYDGDDFLVKEKKHFFFFYLNSEINLCLLIQFFVFETYFIDQRGDVAFADTQPFVLCLCLSELQYLIDEVEQA